MQSYGAVMDSLKGDSKSKRFFLFDLFAFFVFFTRFCFKPGNMFYVIVHLVSSDAIQKKKSNQ